MGSWRRSRMPQIGAKRRAGVVIRPMREWVARVVRVIGLAALGLLVLVWSAWGALLLAYAGPINDVMRAALVLVFCVASGSTLIAVFVRRWRLRALSAFAALCVMLVVFWSSLEPTNDRDWQPQVAILPYATISGDQVTVHNIRNFDYRSKTDYTIAYYDKSFDLRQLRSVDIVTSYLMGPAVAHVFVSFGFADDDYLAVSVEVRYTKGQDYSPLKGLFRQYELVYVVADERDVIRLRTNYRRSPPEDVYVYRVKGSVDGATKVLPGVHESIECFEDAARVLQHSDDQLHHRHLGERWCEPGSDPAKLENSRKRVRSGVPLRGRTAGRHGPVLRRVAAPRPRQRASTGRGFGGGLLPAHSRLGRSAGEDYAVIRPRDRQRLFAAMRRQIRFGQPASVAAVHASASDEAPLRSHAKPCADRSPKQKRRGSVVVGGRRSTANCRA